MAILEKYYLYRPDGTEEIKVEKREPNVNTVKTLTGAHFREEYDSELKLKACMSFYMKKN
mgnify:CR=1 FL=1